MATSSMLIAILFVWLVLDAATSTPWQHYGDDNRGVPESQFSLDPPFNSHDMLVEGRILVDEPAHRFLKARSPPEPSYIIKKLNHDESPLFPSEIIIEILHPKSHLDTWYSVTIVSENRYTGTAKLMGSPRPREMGMAPSPLVYTWKPIFSGDYEVIVHELPQDPVGNPNTLPMKRSNPTLIKVKNKEVPIGPWGMINERMKTLPSCQTVDRMDLYTNWDGSWVGPDMSSHEARLRNGWFFLPHEEMNCKIDTFTQDDFRYLPEEKSIYILGNSKERGIFLSLVDLLLTSDEKKEIQESIISKCWGRAFVRKSNLKVMYQDWRSDNFDTRSDIHTVVCHNDKVAREGGPLFFDSGIKVWEEIFEDRSQWPSVILMSSGNDIWGFKGEMYDINEFVKKLPPEWKGTLLITDGAFSARLAGRGYASDYEAYRQRLKELTAITNDPRVRWMDGLGLSKEMRMYGESGPDHTAISQHFHRHCDVLYHDAYGDTQSMRICSNVTENIAQLLIGHAVGPKDAILARARDPDARQAPQLASYCHACPEDLLPFHITPYPQMTCSVGRLHPNTKKEVQGSHQLCPKECLGLEVQRTKGSQTDLIYERFCPLELFPLGFSVGSEGQVELQRSLGENEFGSTMWFMDVLSFHCVVLMLLFTFRHHFRIRAWFR
ncbi:hypothetical protein HJC23_001067 [Cyclotella cryptica]|uniref:Uncharacterized protein n=1 Tax=Cyclotella cryptica TaxID=29204 RepID=A0ABD3QJU7_9STRA|eukprot:CCRYP_005022-RA/>CCRYP_005022-RA protein AED:0.06 eAED:0.06 QI:0/-1/0/1/-1/1/1/0/662